MENSSAHLYLSQTPSWEWTAQCIQRIIATNDSVQFVGEGGSLLQQYINGTTWGIDRQTCFSHCNSTAISLDFQFSSFAAAFTNYLLPWLGLIAQLPTEAGTKYDGFVSLCLAVGSPALITYSLMLTIRTRYWVRQEFEKLQGAIREVHGRYKAFDQRLAAIKYVLEEAQQVPLRISQEEGWFSSLIVAPGNDEWWKQLKDKLRDTRRGITLSLSTQMLVAIIAWLFTIIAAFQGSLGNVTTALEISAGSVWIWMIPIIAGWIGVGTQQIAKSIDTALETENASLALPGSGHMDPQTNERTYTHSRIQRGLQVADRDASGLTPFTRRTPRIDPRNPDRISNFFNMRGDEKRRGPVFNYARVFTYCHVVGTVGQALSAMMNNIRSRNPCSGEPGTWSEDKHYNRELLGDASQTEAYCGLDQHDIYAYPEWHEIPGAIRGGFIISAGISLFLQWGTTGAAIMIAYLTPTKGLGCRSGGYLLYGVNATVAWLLLALSSFFSHSVMLRYQRRKQKSRPTADKNADTGARGTAGPADGVNGGVAMQLMSQALNEPTDTPVHSHSTEPTWWEFVLRSLAGVTRYAGKLLAILNAFFLVAINLFEFTGGFDNCWCKSDTIGLGKSGWVVLFKTASDLKQAASVPWGTGIATSIMVCVISLLFFIGGM